MTELGGSGVVLPHFEIWVGLGTRIADEAEGNLVLLRVACPWWAGNEAAPLGLPATLAAVLIATLVAKPIDAEDNSHAAAQELAWTFCVSTASHNNRTLEGQDTDLRKLFEEAYALDHAAVAAGMQGILREGSSLPPASTSPHPPPPRPRIYLASALSGFRDVCGEWLEERGIRYPLDATRDQRADLALKWQRRQNGRIARRVRALGLEMYVPHEHNDPARHPDVPNRKVHDRDYGAVVSGDAVIWVGDFPAAGAGKELSWGEDNLGLTLSVTSPGTRRSRLLSGTRTRYAERVDHPEQFEFLAAEWVLDNLDLLIEHRQLRDSRVKWAPLRDALGERRTADRPLPRTLLTDDRVIEVLSGDDFVANTTLDELDTLADALGLRLRIALEPSDATRPTVEDPEVLARWLLRKQGNPTPPIDLVELARTAGITKIEYVPDLRADAETTRTGESFETKLRSNTTPGRERFSLAHEIAHTVIPGPPRVRVHRRGGASAKVERLCDDVAAALLLPDYWINAFLEENRRKGVGPHSLSELRAVARHGGVNLDVAALRLSNVTGSPWMLLRFARTAAGTWEVTSRAAIPSELYRGTPTLGPHSHAVLDHVPDNVDTWVALVVSFGRRALSVRAHVQRDGTRALLLITGFSEASSNPRGR